MVLTELHFPDMDKFKLLEAIREMSSLPVGCLSKGAAVYIPKPITIYDIRTLWQLSVAKRKSLPPNNYLVESVQESSNNKRKQWSSEEQQQRQQPVSKRSKIVWTPELHRKFQHAVHKLGIDRACPKKILQHMNVPELNRKNISSHLQKYRVFYKETVEERKKEILQDYTTVLPDLNPLEKIHATSPFRYYNQGPVSGQPGINPSWTTLGLDSDSPEMMSGNYLQQPRRHLSELGKLLLKVFERFLLSDDYTTPWPGVVAILRAYLTK
ncbi:Two-component response regulator ORR23 [Linum grandiflorum]